MSKEAHIAYYSMEIAVDPAMPTYAGGLGVLAGDTLRSCADAGVSIIAVTLLHRKGYLTQSFDQSGWQRECFIVSDRDLLRSCGTPSRSTVHFSTPSGWCSSTC